MEIAFERRKIICILFLLIIIVTLVNTQYFGIPVLTAYFSFSILVLIAGLVWLTSANKLQLIKIPYHVLAFISLCIYIIIHGEITKTTSLTHFYWLLCGIWLFISTNTLIPRRNLLYGIAIISLIESFVVLLQYIGIFDSLNSVFVSTGTWVNPNVTAMFLAFTLFPALELIKIEHKRSLYIGLLIILCAICLLQCRTAYIISVLFLVNFYFIQIKQGLPLKFNIKRVAQGITIFMILGFLLYILVFEFKQKSTEGRLDIWQNSTLLIKKHPLVGVGFGLFEKEYNFFLARNHLPSQGHVNMPYNDFIELIVEGGVGALLLWVVFLSLLAIHNNKVRISQIPLISFIIIQCTNFGFQSIPTFTLFVFFVGMNNFKESLHIEGAEKQEGTFYFSSKNGLGIILQILCFIISISLLFNQLKLASSFYQTNRIANLADPNEAINKYHQLNRTLLGYPFFHEKYGDAYMNIKQYDSARMQYIQALKYSCQESLLGKTGYCYQQEMQYEKSEHYFTLLQNIAPNKLTPRAALLSLYKQQGDKARMLAKANEIIKMPVKVNSSEADKIKMYANTIINENLK